MTRPRTVAIGNIPQHQHQHRESGMTSLNMIDMNWIASLPLCDTSISDEDVLAVAGQTAELPSPLFAVGFAAIVFLGVAALQFSLGDLNKQEGQARVRDFLQTRRDTERKRGYFD